MKNLASLLSRFKRYVLVLFVGLFFFIGVSPAFAFDMQTLYVKNRVSSGPVGWISCDTSLYMAYVNANVYHPLTINGKVYSDAQLGTAATSFNLVPQIHPTFPDNTSFRAKLEKFRSYGAKRTILDPNKEAQVDFTYLGLTVQSAERDKGFSVFTLVDHENEEQFALACKADRDDSGTRNPNDNDPALTKKFMDELKRRGYGPIPVPVPVGAGARGAAAARAALCLVFFRRPC
jgi:hypothetical protein